MVIRDSGQDHEPPSQDYKWLALRVTVSRSPCLEATIPPSSLTLTLSGSGPDSCNLVYFVIYESDITAGCAPALKLSALFPAFSQ